jgi:hypothetical protein
MENVASNNILPYNATAQMYITQEKVIAVLPLQWYSFDPYTRYLNGVLLRQRLPVIQLYWREHIILKYIVKATDHMGADIPVSLKI